MISLTITALAHGWADIEIDLNGCNLICCFEYTPNDAFAELLKSAFDITTINKLDPKISFPNGADKTILSINKLDDNNCNITVGDISIKTTIKQYVKAVLRMFDKYIYTHTKEEYTIEWHQPFPSDIIEKLRHQYKIL